MSIETNPLWKKSAPWHVTANLLCTTDVVNYPGNPIRMDRKVMINSAVAANEAIFKMMRIPNNQNGFWT